MAWLKVIGAVLTFKDLPLKVMEFSVISGLYGACFVTTPAAVAPAGITVTPFPCTGSVNVAENAPPLPIRFTPTL